VIPPPAARFCVIGGDGLIGAALCDDLRLQGQPAIASTRRAPIDAKQQFFLDLQGDPEHFRLPEADVVVLTASMTRLAECRANPADAWRANVDAQLRLAEEAVRRGAFVVFLSTNQVFDGMRPGMKPDAPMSARSVYGKLKAEAEMRLLALGESVCVVRLSKVIAPRLQLFAHWRRDLSNGGAIVAFDDLVMAPIAISKVVAGIERLGRARANGVWHLGGREDMSYVAAGRRIAWRLGVDQDLVRVASAAQAGIPEEERPPHTVLAPGDIEKATGVEIADAETELDIGLGFT